MIIWCSGVVVYRLCFVLLYVDLSCFHRYRLSCVGSNGDDEIELVFFDRVANELIGRPVVTLLRSRAPHGVSLEEVVMFGRTDELTLREIAAVVSRKFCLVVSVTAKSFDPESDKPSYQVHRIDMEYGRQPLAAAIRCRPGLALAPSNNSSNGVLNSLCEDVLFAHPDDVSSPGEGASAVSCCLGLSTT